MCLLTAFAALLVGGASGLFGIGGGFLIVPALLAATGMPMINAVGSSLLAVSAFGLATAINYAASGLIDWLLAAEFIGGGIFGGMIDLNSPPGFPPEETRSTASSPSLFSSSQATCCGGTLPSPH